MSRLAPAIRIRRRQLDALALRLATDQATLGALAEQAAELQARRASERRQGAVAPIACDAWFEQGARRLADLADARVDAERNLAALRAEAIQVRARLRLLDDAAAEAHKAERRRRLARAEAALDDRIAAAWCRR